MQFDNINHLIQGACYGIIAGQGITGEYLFCA